MQNFEQEMIKKLMNKNKTIHINITNRCNAKCKHCINQEGKTVLGEASLDDVKEWIRQVAKTDYKNINFVGGEPFLLLRDLQEYSELGAELGLTIGVTTNGFWGKTKESAIETLEKVPYVKKILVSTDSFHQEFFDIETIYHVVDACLQKKRFIAVNAVCKNKEECEKVKDQFAKYKSRVYVNTAPVMPEGSAKHIQDELECFNLQECQQNLSSYCGIREHYIDCTGGISACCMSTLMLDQNVLYLGNLNQDTLEGILQMKCKNPVIKKIEEEGPLGLYQFIKAYGYENELNRSYSGDCEFCKTVLSNKKILQKLIEIEKSNELPI